ncbi:MAG: hypothetical protein KDA28_09060, partial [Phycisphaerales bacterium]|nr:hypothetical protein [Phycisphaerales bacterium]
MQDDNRTPDMVGADGLVAAICTSLGERGVHIGLADALGITGLAFAHYAFTPDDNHAYRAENPGIEWRWDALDVENYGVLESLSAHTRHDLRRYDGLTTHEAWKVAAHELGEGRGLVAMTSLPTGGARGCACRWGIVESLDADARTMSVRDTEGERSVPFAFTTVDEAKQPSPLPSLIAIRPSGEPAPARRLRALRDDVVRWCPTHFGARKELIHHLELFYAAGARAWTVLAEWLDKRFSADSAPLVEQAEWWTRWSTSMELRRLAAACFLDSRRVQGWGTPEGLVARAGLGAAADAYRETVEAIAGLAA